MAVIKVFSVGLDIDLSDFTAQLWRLKIRHRVVFEEQQILLVEDEESAALVLHLYQQWQEEGEIPAELVAEIKQIKTQRLRTKKSVDIKSIPLVITLLLLSVLLSVAVEFGDNVELLSYFTITDFQLQSNQVRYFNLQYNFETLELWRFISPIFIHFNVPHIIFNSLWIWVVGSVIEQRHGTKTLMFVVVISALASNVAQYYVSGPIFGGLSGVVYAVLGYAWLWDKLRQDKLRVVPNALMGFMLFWLVLGYTGVLSQLGLGNIANTAHLVGLISALVAVPVMMLIKPLKNA